jgi:hypothetical protein
MVMKTLIVIMMSSDRVFYEKLGSVVVFRVSSTTRIKSRHPLAS